LPKTRLIIGRKPLLEALQEGKDIEKIFLLKTAAGEELFSIRKAAKEQNIALSYVPQEKLNRLTQANHQGVVAIAGLIPFQPLQEIISRVVDQGGTPLVLMLDGVTDTRNLGAIARSAYCYGVHALVIPSANNAAITEDAVKTSAGALEHLPVCRAATIEEAMTVAQLNGLQVVATTLQSATSISAVDFTAPTAIIMGAEDKGVSASVLKTADHLARIPMSGAFESLNVAVAAGIILYEVNRQNLP
jgi:23S rRNA (guanosine2251-2'-O)-methyltransferase